MIPEKNPESYPADLLITGGIVLPMNGQPPISQGGIAVKGDRILAVGKNEEICRTFRAARTLDKPAHLIMPGLVNTHTHAAMSLFRGLADDLPLMEWLNQYIFPAERRINDTLVHLGTRLACCEMIRTGTTTFKDMYLFEEAVAEATARMGVRAVVGEVLYDFPSPNYGPFEEGLAYTQRMIGKWKGHPLVRVAVEPHSPYTCSPESLRHAHRIAESEQCPLVLHLAETRDEVEQIRQRYGTTPVRHLERLGILGPQVLAVHCVWLDEEEIRILADHQVKVAHCPESNMKLAAGIAPVPALLRAGVTVGLGTDGCASNNNLDMFQEMDMAAKLHKVATGDPTVMDAPTVLAMATTEAARALGLADEIGSL
ncbi:MAG: amidohydrolase family protein, partial [bacterium]